MIELLTRPRVAPLLVLAVSAGALGLAYFAQYGLGLEPCILCLYQRIPYAVAGALAMVAVVRGSGGRELAAIMALIALAYFAEAAIAFYHVGVEQHWWVAVTACGGEIPMGLSAEDLLAALTAEPAKRCDEITWTILGQSVTVYNTAAGLALMAATGALAVRLWRR